MSAEFRDTLLLDFGGGLEQYVPTHQHRMELPHSELFEFSEDCKAKDLVKLLAEKHLGDHGKHMVDENGELLPGILMLVNEADVELLGGVETTHISPGDSVSFISTLHGG